MLANVIAALGLIAGQEVIINPSWIEPPRPDSPLFAQLIGIDGRVRLSCTVQTTGRLADCSVTSAEPSGLGFDRAALASIPSARLNPRTVDGEPAASQIVFAVNFIAEGMQGMMPAETTPYDGPSPSQKALDLALQVIDADLVMDPLHQEPMIINPPDDLGVDPDRTALVRGWLAGSDLLPDRGRTDMALVLARVFTETDLRRILKGQAPDRSIPTDEEMLKAMAGLFDPLAADAAVRDLYCARYDCTIGDEAAPAP